MLGFSACGLKGVEGTRLWCIFFGMGRWYYFGLVCIVRCWCGGGWSSWGVLFVVWCLWCVGIMFLSSFLIFMVVLVVGMIVLWDCGLFLVFHVWVGIVVVGVGIGFFVFGGSGGGGVVWVCCCHGVFCYCVRVWCFWMYFQIFLFRLQPM